MSDLDHWIWKWLESGLTLLAKIIVLSRRALISDAFDWILITAVADAVGVKDFGLVFLLLLKMISQHLLILLCAVFVHLDLENLVEVSEELGLELSSRVALLAWQPFLVNFGTVASEAIRHVIAESDILVNVAWSKNEAADLFLCSDGILLASLGFSIDFSIAHYLLELDFSLRSDLIGGTNGVNKLL